MITITQLTELLGWGSVISMGFLVFATLGLISMRSFAVSMHSKILGVPEGELPTLYFQYLANLKILSMLLFVIPWVSLKIMGH